MSDYSNLSVPELYGRAATSYGLFPPSSGWDIAVTRDTSFTFGDYGVKTRGHNIEGSSAFLRSKMLQEGVMRRAIGASCDGRVRALVVPGAIGCEATSLSMIVEHYAPEADVKIDTFDISALFTAIAQKQTYPYKMTAQLDAHYKAMFNNVVEGDVRYDRYVVPSASVVSRVNVLPAGNIFNFTPEKPYDVVFCMNLLRHLDGDGVIRMLNTLGPLTKNLLCFNGLENFSQDINAAGRAQYDVLEETFRQRDRFSLLTEGFIPFADGRSLPEPRHEMLKYYHFNVERKLDGSNFVLARGLI